MNSWTQGFFDQGLAVIALSVAAIALLLIWRSGWRPAAMEQQRQRARLNDQSMRILSSAVEQSQSGVIIADCSGVIEYVNPRYTQITGYSKDDAVGRVAELINNEELTDVNNISLQEALLLGVRWETFMVSKRRNSEHFWQQVTVSPILDDLGALTHIVLNIEDISDRVETQAQMEKLAFYDALTGLENRRLFRDRLEQGLKHVRRSKQAMALLFLDLDQFKRINDTLGHDAGDELLCTVAQRLRACVREEDIVARLGGDEFTILLSNIASADDAGLVARKILKSLLDPVTLSTQEVTVSCSIGITVAPEDSLNASVLMRNADLAMYRAKDQGRNNFQYFTDDMNIESLARMSLENELRIAITNEDFVVHFQPQMDLSQARVCGYEALVRWRHEQVDVIPPDRFIPVAEETGLIIQLGEIVLRQACLQMKALQSSGISDQSVAVNLSARQFRDRNLVPMVRRILSETGLAPRWLELEITESMLMDNIEQAISILTELKSIGVAIAIDDFGTGYSSLSYLTQLPVDKLKVDRSFVNKLPDCPRHTAITTAIIAMAQRLNLQVVAEGVETEPQASFLSSHQCNIQQGYLFCHPVSAAELPAQMIRMKSHLASVTYPQATPTAITH
ncbi:putative bifunctional diguanylate cyclase/phosphodiesterase [Pseudohongiella acticola]|jgi:diguanylate cyclase (GGDEF)-like protein/PAS domain S-box-containing protein|uniref:putative bifunctional diguanylate cyclase/phosphodiesterase n=1 Tax=Pseudohongiella acticola TaxID=1524254 RepID=UPI0030EE3184